MQIFHAFEINDISCLALLWNFLYIFFFPYLLWQLIVRPSASLLCPLSVYLSAAAVSSLALLPLLSHSHFFLLPPTSSLSTCLALLLLLFLLRLSTHFLPPIIKVIATFLPLAFVCLVCLCAEGRGKMEGK